MVIARIEADTTGVPQNIMLYPPRMETQTNQVPSYFQRSMVEFCVSIRWTPLVGSLRSDL